MFSSIFMLNIVVLLCLTLLFKPILALHIMNISRCRNYWAGGGGGGAKRRVCHPNIFMGSDCPPPPQDRRLCEPGIIAGDWHSGWPGCMLRNYLLTEGNILSKQKESTLKHNCNVMEAW